MFKKVCQFYGYCQKKLDKQKVSVNVVTTDFSEAEIIDALAFCGAIVYEGQKVEADAYIENDDFYIGSEKVDCGVFENMDVGYVHSNARIKKRPS